MPLTTFDDIVVNFSVSFILVFSESSSPCVTYVSSSSYVLPSSGVPSYSFSSSYVVSPTSSSDLSLSTLPINSHHMATRSKNGIFKPKNPISLTDIGLECDLPLQEPLHFSGAVKHYVWQKNTKP